MKYKCIVCKDEFKSKKELKKDDRYCGYCETVHRGEPDTKWLPSIKGDDIDRKGFHKI